MEKLFYKLDNLFVKYSSLKLWILAILSIVVVLVGGILLSLYNNDISLSLWNSWTYLVDPGTHVEVVGKYNRTVSVGITIIGMVFFALLVGLISEVINEKFDSLKTGKTTVYEENHIVILGWSEKIFTLIEELNLSFDTNIVVLSTLDKESMEKNFKENITIKNEVICRSGDIDNICDLEKISIKKAQTTILLANDNLNLKTTLLLLKELNLKQPINVEMEKDEYKIIFDKLENQYKNLNVIYTKESMARLLAQSSLYKNLIKIYEKLFTLSGDSFYLVEKSDFYRLSIKELSLCINDDITFCGIYSYKHKKLILEKSYIYEKGDKLVILANSNYKIYNDEKLFKQEKVDLSYATSKDILIVGYNDTSEVILNELEDKYQEIYLASTSDIDIITQKNLKTIRYTKLSDLLTFDVENILITSDVNDTIKQKDNKVLATLMMLESKNYKNIVSEIFDTKMMNLIKNTNINYIISNQLIGKFLATVTTSNELKSIIVDLLEKDGNLIQIATCKNKIDYKDLYLNLIEKDIILLGYIYNNKIILNPMKKNFILNNSKVIIIKKV